ncbi:MAG: zinc-dependent metalloprotease [bacterium]|nr:zinc-dependent metalloprotease [bacterium]
MKVFGSRILAVALLACLMTVSTAEAQKKKKKGKDAATEVKKDKNKGKSVSATVKDMMKTEGLFTFYRDSTTGSMKMVINQDQIDQEFIHFYYIENGATEASAFKGQFRGSRIFKIEKYFDKIEFVTQNTSSYFDPENALSKSADANFSRAIVFSGKIEAGDEKEGKYLINADDLFLKETVGMVKFPSFSQNPRAFKLGSLSKSKTKYRGVKGYPENSDVVVEYVYENALPKNFGSRAVTDARNVSITVQHSLIEVPENNFQPRFDDPRVGYFMQQVNDMTSTEAVTYRDIINRWDLQKKDPSAAISEPVEPITWWIENTTPEEFRPTIEAGVLEWNKAFEKAGFKNAMVVKVQPDDAEWDAGDIRYNVLRWTSSPNPPFGGYGPSFVNPRTGQILGADIMLEFVFHTNRVKYDKLFAFHEDHAFDADEINPLLHNEYFCSFGETMQMNNLFGQAALKSFGASDLEMEGMKKEAMMQLIMHEVGHTLGLNHNMKSSQNLSVDQLYDKSFTQGISLTGSIMDYANINVTPNREDQGQYYSVTVGPYDIWAIEFGYTPTDEAGLNKILSRSTDPQLIFGNDADDMRSPGKAIDPRVNVSDLSNDQIRYMSDRIEMVNDVMESLKGKYLTDGNTYQEFRQAFYMLHRQYANALNVMSRFVGGVYVDRSVVGQEGASMPYTPVSYKDQKRAMNALAKYAFAPNAYDVPDGLFNYMAVQRRGFNFFGNNEDPKLHDRVLSSQKSVLNHILHYTTLQRISDSELYGNEYSLSEYMVDLNDAIFKADTYTAVNTYRQNLQVEYTNRLIAIIGSDNQTTLAKSMALYNLNNIKKIANTSSRDISTKAHRQHLALLIDNALEK